ncbi:hypothetical protein OGAPHI_001713 [Ogataea philodendri]|uniref:Transcription factor domain-containing protein n=1 Tax=Ogataea philodendri TaxID=1378263 RepID=A0A9P8PAL4_9ASCO|nr:uncharacterized protein OGAPHI_001713 [Ogataea philodendri]KAH3667959.1 hypothetical protein OGAPHI_001713 [Ogataea philodendri]
MVPKKTLPRVAKSYPSPETSIDNLSDDQTRSETNAFDLPGLPPKAECNELVKQYSTTIHPLIPIVNLERFFECYSNPTRNDPIFVLQFITVIYSSIAITKMPSEQLIRLLEKQLEHATPIQKCESLVVLLFVQPKNPFGSVCSLVRLAYSLNLHRDPILFHNITNKQSIQYYRALWWSVLQLDCIFSLSNDLPSTVLHGQYDTLRPDEYIRETQKATLDPYIAFANTISQWCACSSSLWNKKYALHPISDQDIKSSENEIQDFALYCSSTIQSLTNDSQLQTIQLQMMTSVLMSLSDRLKLILLLLREKTRSIAFLPPDNNLIQSLLTPISPMFSWYTFFQPFQISVSLFRSVLSQIRHGVVPIDTVLLLQRALQCTQQSPLKKLFEELWGDVLANKIGGCRLKSTDCSGFAKNPIEFNKAYFDSQLIRITNNCGGIF